MTLKKINSICSWILILCLLGHLGTMSYSMFTDWYSYNICKNLAYMTAGTAAVHILISMILVLFYHDGADFKNYKRNNRATLIQRVSGIGIVLLLHLHVQAFGFITSGEALSAMVKTELIVTEVAFFGLIFAHLAVSLSKSWISVGIIRSEITEQKINRLMYIICMILFIVTTSALVSYVLRWKGNA